MEALQVMDLTRRGLVDRHSPIKHQEEATVEVEVVEEEEEEEEEDPQEQ